MDIGSIILIVALVLGGAAVLIAVIWAIVAITAFSQAKKVARDVQANLNLFDAHHGRRRLDRRS